MSMWPYVDESQGSKIGTAQEPPATSRPSLRGPYKRDVDALGWAKTLWAVQMLTLRMPLACGRRHLGGSEPTHRAPQVSQSLWGYIFKERLVEMVVAKPPAWFHWSFLFLVNLAALWFIHNRYHISQTPFANCWKLFQKIPASLHVSEKSRISGRRWLAASMTPKGKTAHQNLLTNLSACVFANIYSGKKGGGHKTVRVSKTLWWVSRHKLARKQNTKISTRKLALCPRKWCVSEGVSNFLRPCEMKNLFSTAQMWNVVKLWETRLKRDLQVWKKWTLAVRTLSDASYVDIETGVDWWGKLIPCFVCCFRHRHDHW